MADYDLHFFGFDICWFVLIKGCSSGEIRLGRYMFAGNCGNKGYIRIKIGGGEMLTKRIIESSLDNYEKEYLNSARQFLEEALKEKNIRVKDIRDFDRMLLCIGMVYENLVTCQRAVADNDQSDFNNMDNGRPCLRRIK